MPKPRTVDPPDYSNAKVYRDALHHTKRVRRDILQASIERAVVAAVHSDFGTESVDVPHSKLGKATLEEIEDAMRVFCASKGWEYGGRTVRGSARVSVLRLEAVKEAAPPKEGVPKEQMAVVTRISQPRKRTEATTTDIDVATHPAAVRSLQHPPASRIPTEWLDPQSSRSF